MRRNLAYWLLGMVAVGLMAGNILMWPKGVAPGGEASPKERSTQTDEVLEEGEDRTNAGPSKKSEAAPEQKRAEERKGPALNFHWSTVESTDYKQYAANLRQLGFPEELVQGIVIADLNKLYEPREAALRLPAVPFDAPVSERQRKTTVEDLERMRELRQVQMEKQGALQEILGIYVPREVMKTPTSRNYIAYEYALSQLPEEKREAAQTALENEWFEDDINKHLDRATYVEVYRRTREERNAALRAVLTPEEFERFESHSNPAGTELARRTIGMEPSEEEFSRMFPVAWEHWVETGGVGGLWRAQRVPREQIADADAKLEQRMQEVLGAERYLDYRMASSEMGQKMRNLGARYGLTRETIGRAFELQTEADRLAKAAGNATPQPGSQLAEVHQQIERTLGPVVWEAWQDGRHQRVKLDP